jgi:hypothetical protein
MIDAHVQPFHRLVVNYLNVVFGTSPESTNFWDTKLITDVESKFDGVKFQPTKTTATRLQFKDLTAYGGVAVVGFTLYWSVA